jgi:hypothetical protein
VGRGERRGEAGPREGTRKRRANLTQDGKEEATSASARYGQGAKCVRRKWKLSAWERNQTFKMLTLAG